MLKNKMNEGPQMLGFYVLTKALFKKILAKKAWSILFITTFISLNIPIAKAALSPEEASRLMPIILMVLEDDGAVNLNLGQLNTVTFSNNKTPEGATANFDNVRDELTLSLIVSDLEPRQSLDILLNGFVVDTINTNGVINVSLSLDELNAFDSGDQNILEFIPSNNAVWTISDIKLISTRSDISRSQAVRFLTKATFGATEESIERLMQLGYEDWIDEQLTIPATEHYPFYEQALIDRAAGGIDMGASQRCVSRMDAWWNGTIRGEDQLRQRMAFALSQIFVVDDSDCQISNAGHLSYYDLLLNGAFGNYRDLLENVTLSVTMGSFLNMRGSRALSASGNTSPDENYAREVLQLFSIGLNELNIDGSLKLDSQNRPIETYDNAIVHDIARALTGWQWPDGRFSPLAPVGALEPWNGLYARWHDHGEKTILNGVVIPAGDRDTQSGNTIVDDLKITLDTIAAHDNVAPFISKLLIQRFVSSNPSPEYIARVATVFNDNGSGVKGDFGAVIKAILLDYESIDSHLMENAGKLKEPLMRVSQIWRSLNATSPLNYIRFLHTERFLGQAPMSSNSVFNFYRPDYSPLGSISERGLVAPEYSLITDDALNIQTYWVMQRILNSTVNVDDDVEYSPTFNVYMKLDLTEAKSLSVNSQALLNYFDELLFGGLMSDQLREVVIDYIDNEVDYSDLDNDDERRERKVEEALLILGVSPEYNVQN